MHKTKYSNDTRIHHMILHSGGEEKKEYESKYRVKWLPENLDQYPREEIAQGYVAFLEGGMEVRVRRKGNKYFQTSKMDKKSIEDGRPEEEREISKRLFESLWPYAKGKIEKTRYYIRHGERIVELDVFRGDNKGVIAEVEFPGKEEKKEYVPLEWIDTKIADNDKRYRNGYISIHGMPKDPLLTSVLRTNNPQWALPLEEGLNQIIRELGTRMMTGKTPILVGIAGGSASGKSSMVAAKLKEALGDDAEIISMDHYYRPLKEVEALPKIGNMANFDTPDALRLEQLYDHLRLLRVGKTIARPTYDFASSGPLQEKVKITPHKVILVEGLYSLDDEHFGDIFDFKIFVQASEFSQFIRRLFRDIKRTSMQPSETTALFFTAVLPGQRKFVDPTRMNADIVVINEYNPNVEAKISGIINNQVKFKGAVDESQLIKLQANMLLGTTQSDEHYIPKVQGKAPDFVRLRMEGDTLVFTYKGPSTKEDSTNQPRFEFRFKGAPTELRQWIRGICGEQIATVNKHRVSYQYFGVTINVDSGVKVRAGNETYARNLGSFVELAYSDDAETRARVQEVINALGLKNSIKTNYYEM